MRHLSTKLLDIDKIIDVYNIIKRHTKNRGKLFNFEMFFACNIISIYEVLKNKKYKHGMYNVFLIAEPKYRIIMSEDMSDKIINHLISKYVLNPLILPKLIEQNVATRKNKGTKSGLMYTKKYINHLKMNNDKIYVLKCDISKYFYNINHEIILKKLDELILDKDVYNIIYDIINSTNSIYVNLNIDKVINKEIERIEGLNITNKIARIKELKEIPRYENGKGLPIGNMTSQILAIFYLNEVDHYIKEQLHCKYYVRYMDDFLIFDSNKDNLKIIKEKISKKLKEYKLELNHKTNIYDIDKGFNFLGYYFFLKKKKLIIKINSKSKRRIKKKIKKLYNKKWEDISRVKASYRGHLNFANSKELERLIFESK